jgi:hypothetical protein
MPKDIGLQTLPFARAFALPTRPPYQVNEGMSMDRKNYGIISCGIGAATKFRSNG